MAASPGLLLLLLFPLAWSAGAELLFASYYADHMVLQKAPSRAVLWGHGDLGANILVTLRQEKKHQPVMKKKAAVKAKLKVWKVLLNPMAPGGPYTIEIQQIHKGNTSNITLNDVYFGDVWLCSGQSNMEMTVSQIFNASEELAAASMFPLVRIFAPALVQSEIELEDLAGISLQWSIPTAKNLGNGDFSYFSAVCWLFGQYLFDKLKYPIGLIDSSWGGTPVETWSSNRALQKCGISAKPTNSSHASKENGPHTDSVLWNAMIHPLLNMTLHGAIWYQGEENTKINTELYNCTFPTLIDDWRIAFHDASDGQTPSDFPFGFVQLCTDRHVQINDHFSHIRWHQTADYGYVPNKRMLNTFMAVTIDLGDSNSPYGSIHPRDKQTVAYRLYLGALAVAYGMKNVVFQGPYPQQVQVDVFNKSINVTFKQDIHFRILDNKTFEARCCNKSPCSWTSVLIKSVSSQSVLLYNPVCPEAVTGLRYAWTEWPCEYKQCPLYNRQNLPVPPFITFAHNNPGWIFTKLSQVGKWQREELAALKFLPVR